MDKLSLQEEFIYNNKKIETYGDLRKLVTTIKFLESIEDFVEEGDYIYMYKWLQRKIWKEEKNNIQK